MYAEEFVRAYERQIAEYKRLGGADDILKETVVLDKAHVNPDVGEADTPELSADDDTDAVLALSGDEVDEIEANLAGDEVANEDMLPAEDFLDDNEPDQAKG